MFAISFDLVVAETELRHPKGATAAYDEIARTLKRYDFARIHFRVENWSDFTPFMKSNR